MGIDLPFDPNLYILGPLRLSWHGIFSVVGIVAGVWLSLRLVRARVSEEHAYSIATWGVLGGFVGARLFHVVDQWAPIYSHDPLAVFEVWNGGIAIVGAVVGGVSAGFVRALRLRVPIGFGADGAAPGLALGMGIGRIGDLINGEHWAQPCSDLPWCVRYTNPNTLGQGPVSNPPFDSVHPVTTYEMLWDYGIVALLLWLHPRFAGRPGEGRLLWLFLALYGIGRTFLSFLRYARPEGTGDAVIAFGLSQAQLVSVGFVALGAVMFVYLSLRGAAPRTAPA